MQTRNNQHILVLGAGNFGTCLGQHLASQGHRVELWARSPEVAEGINLNHTNPRYLKEIPLSSRLKAFTRLEEAPIQAYDAIVIAVPTQYVRMVVEQISDKMHIDQLLVCAAKGIEVGTEKLPSDIMAEICGTFISHHMVSLSTCITSTLTTAIGHVHRCQYTHSVPTYTHMSADIHIHVTYPHV